MMGIAFRQFGMFGLLLVTGCASSFSVHYDPVIDIDILARSDPASIVQKVEKSLVADGYCKIGRVEVSYRVGSRPVETPASRLISEATRRGGDLVRIETENVLSDKTEYKNGACLEYADLLTQVETPDYKEKCTRDEYGYQTCTYSADKTITKTQIVHTCTRWEQVPVVMQVMTTTASVWRRDFGICPMLVGLDVVVSGQSHPHHIAVNAKNVYWTNTGTEQNNFTDGTIMMVPIAGGDAVTLASGQTHINGIAVDATNVYWSTEGTVDKMHTDGTVMMVPIAGGSARTLASSQTHINGIAVDATNVYWSTKGTVDKMHTDGTVMMVPIAGGTPTQLASGYYYTEGIAVDAESIYWIDKGTGAEHYTDGAVMKMPIRGGKPIALATGQHEPEDIAVDATSVYWTSNYDKVMKVPIQGGNPTMLSSGQHNIQGIAVHGKSVYWVNGGKPGDDVTYGMVMTMPSGGGTPKPLASAQRFPIGIAVDDSSVYWTSNKGGKVMKSTLQ